MTQPNKSLGQHWLFDEKVLSRMADAGEVNSRDTVLEIGPGLGSLTAHLCNRAKKVVAVEADQQLANGLGGRVQADNLEVISADILEFDLSVMPSDYKVVANIPYYITSQLMRILWGNTKPPLVAALLLQKEVAERIVAGPGQMSVLALSVQYYAKPVLLEVVPKELFEPIPKVDSAILQLKRRPKPYFEADEKKLFWLIKAGFSSRRKKLINALAGGMQIDKDEAGQLVQGAGLDTNVRAQELSLLQWQSLYKQLHNN